MDKNGDFKAIYYDGYHFERHASKIKVVDNGKRRITDNYGKELEKMKELFNFLSGTSDYSDSGNEDKDHSLLVSIRDGASYPTNYYYWKNDEQPPKGVESLLEFLDKLCKTDDLPV